MAENALRQIEEKKHNSDLTAQGVENVLKYGLAFSGKSVLIQASFAWASRVKENRQLFSSAPAFACKGGKNLS